MRKADLRTHTGGCFQPDFFEAPAVKAPESTTRQKIVMLVGNFVSVHCRNNNPHELYQWTYNRLYDALRCSEVRFNVFARARMYNMDKMEVIEMFGLIDELYAIAVRDLPKYDRILRENGR